MNAEERNKTLEAARALVKRGQVDAGVHAFLRVGAFEDAANALVSVRRFTEAGQLLMNALGVGPQMVAGLDAERKKLATKAAVCFAHAGDVKTSVELYLALGDPMRAAEILERSGDQVTAARVRAQLERRTAGNAPVTRHASDATSRAAALRLEKNGQLEEALQAYLRLRQVGEAARVAASMGRLADAGQLYEEAGKPYEAADCFLRAGDTGRCLDCLVLVTKEHPQYRAAAILAIQLANQLGALDFKVDHFLSAFLRDAPLNVREMEACFQLAGLYRRRDFLDNAREVYEKIARRDPNFRDVTKEIRAIDEAGRVGVMAYAAIVRDDAAFRASTREERPPLGGELFPDLPSLPPLPGEVPVHAPTQAIRGGAGPAQPAAVRVVTPHGMAGASGVATPHGTPGQPPATRALGGRAAPAPNAPAPPPPPPEAPAPTPVDATNWPAGMVIATRYRIEQKLGEGGMACVYRAHDLELGEDIAMKVFFGHADEQLLTRFKQELSLSRQLAHPNIVRLYDIGSHAGMKFITMELLRGRDLRAVLDQGPLDFGRGLKYLIHTCQGLAVAHERGITHRDLKPENLFVTQDEQVKVMDFGIAKANTKSALTVAGFIAGTPAYMSPEQINNFGSVTHLSDIYALGCVAYEMFSGRVPFIHDELMPLLQLHLTTAPEPPSHVNPKIPPELEDIILRLLEKAPQKRIQSCRELASYLSELQPRR